MYLVLHNALKFMEPKVYDTSFWGAGGGNHREQDKGMRLE